MSSKTALRSLIVALVLAASSAVAPAATLTWDANGTTATVTDGAGAWVTGTNWWNGTTTTTWTSGDDAVFGVGGTGGAVTLSATTSVASLTFNTFAGTYTLGTTGTTLTIGAGGLTMNSGSGAVTIISPVVLGAAQSWTNNKAGTLTVSGSIGNGGNTLTVSGTGPSTLSGAISGAGGLTKLGTGRVTLTGSNSYSGATTISAGTLLAGHASALSSGTISFGGGTLQYNAASASQDWSGRFKNSGSSISLDTNGSNVTLAGGIDSTNVGGLTKLGTGTLTLSGSNFYTGSTQINGGTLLAGHASALSSGTISFGGGTLQYTAASAAQDWSGRIRNSTSLISLDTNAQNVTLAGGIDSTNVGGLTKLGSGTLTLSGSNGFSGATTVSAGELHLSNGSFNRVSSIIPNAAGATVRLTNAIVTNTTAVTINRGSFIQESGTNVYSSDVAVGNETGQSGVYRMEGGLLQSGNAGFSIGGRDGTFIQTGGTVDARRTSGSVLQLAGASGVTNARGSYSISGGTLNVISGASIQIGFFGAGSIGTFTISSDAVVNSSVGTFLGNGANAVQGILNLEGGVLRSTLVYNSGTFANHQFNFSGGTLSPYNANSTIGSLTANNNTTVTLSGTTATMSSNDKDGIGRTVTVYSNLTGAGALTFIGSGKHTLSGSNTYAGSTQTNAGTLQFVKPASLYGGTTANWTAANIVTGSGATLAVSVGASNFTTGNVTTLLTNLGGLGGSVTDNGLKAGSSIGFDTSSAGGSFTVADSIADSTGTGGGAIGLVKLGSGTLTLSAANTYSGATTISAGSLVLGNASAIGAGSGNLVVSGGVLDLGGYNVTRTGTVSFTGGTVQSGTITSNTAVAYDGQSGTVADTATLAGSAGLIKTTSGTLTVGTSRTYTGETIVNAGKLILRSNAGQTFSSPLTINNNGTVELNGLSTGGNVYGDITVNAGGLLSLGPAGANVSIRPSSLTLNGGTVARHTGFNGLSVTGTITAAGEATSTITSPIVAVGNNQTINIDVKSASTLLVSGAITPEAASGVNLTKTDVGTLILSTANTYQGLTTVSAGALNIRNNTALGTVAVGTTVTTNAALEVQGGITVGAEALTLNGSGISSGGALRNISDSNTYGGAITLGSAARINSDAGTLTLDVASGNAVAGAHNLTFGGAGNISVADAIATSAVIKDGAGTLTLSASNAYQGGTTINFGTLRAGHANSFGAGAIVLANGAALDLDNLAIANAITNNGGTISGLAGYVGTQNVVGLTALTGTVGGSVNVGNGGTLKGTNTAFTGAVVIADQGIHSPGNSPGVQTFESGINYNAGSTLIWELVGNTTSNPGTAFDLVNVTGGNLSIADGALLQLEFQNTGLVSSTVNWSDAFWNVAQSWTIIDFSSAGTSSGNFTLLGSGTSWLDSTGASLATVRSNASFQVSRLNNDVVLSYVIVPEPGTLALAGIGIAAAAWAARRRKTLR